MITRGEELLSILIPPTAWSVEAKAGQSMTLRVEPRAEPIPGYKLIECLGSGGYGEVWKAEAPGGFLKAIKFVHGDVEHVNSVEVEQELRSLECVKSIRHPFILALDRFDLIDGQLVIVMELADRSLWDRFEQCRAQGLPGIPREELLLYLGEAAEALDMMNSQYNLQHNDVKPQNLFLLHNHLKVGDFGLVKNLEGLRALGNSGFTAIYAAPESFNGIISRCSDQYSLAIVYQYLLTGHRPFVGPSWRQLMMQHLSDPPNLTSLPEGERPVVARALAKNPEERHASCLDFIRMLLANGTPLIGDPPIVRSTSGSWHALALTRQNRGAVSSTVQIRKLSAPPARQTSELVGDGVLKPALVIGLGGAGLAILQQCRKALCARWGAALLANIRLLQVDTDPGVVHEAAQGHPDGRLSDQEILLTRLRPTSHYLKPVQGQPALESWLNPSLMKLLPRDQLSTGSVRAFGRLAFVDNYQAIVNRLRTELAACCHPHALASAERDTGLAPRTNRPRVYLLACLAGGTGSGMVIDMAYLVRCLLQEQGWDNPDVAGVFLMPAVEKGAGQVRSVANTCAALAEINHFSDPGVRFVAGYRDSPHALKDAKASTTTPPFSQCFLLPAARPGTNAAQEITSLAGDWLCRDLTTSLGRAMDQGRDQLRAPSGATSLRCRTFGLYRLSVPRREMQQQMARALTSRLAQGWLQPDPTCAEQSMQAWIQEQWTRREAAPEWILSHLQAVSTSHLGAEPDAMFAAIVDPIVQEGPEALLRNVGPVQAALAQWGKVLGQPRADGPGPLSPLQEVLAEACKLIGAKLRQKLVDLPRAILAEPLFRLQGTEQSVHQHLVAGFTDMVREQGETSRQALLQAETTYQRLQSLLGDLRSLFSWGRGKKTRSAAELLELLPSYPRILYQALLHWRVSAVYQDLLAALPIELPSMSCCRNRTVEVLRGLANPGTAPRWPGDSALARWILPAECRTPDQAAAQMLAELTPNQFLDLAQRVQNELTQPLKAQVHVCTTASRAFQMLRETLGRQTEAFAKARVDSAAVTEIYLERQNGETQVLDDLASAFEAAAPRLASGVIAPLDEICLLSVPEGAAGQRLRTLASRALPAVKPVVGAHEDDLVFYRERPHLALAELPQMGPEALEIYHQAMEGGRFTPHSRADILEWRANWGE